MYILKEETKELLKKYKQKAIAKEVGINPISISQMIRFNKPCIKLTAYCLTKFLNSDAEINDFFIRIEKGE